MTCVVEETSFVTVVESETVVVGVGAQGPGGAKGQDGAAGTIGTIFDFSYGDATPALICTVDAGKRIYTATILIDEPFDGVGAVLSVGLPGLPDAVFPAALNAPGAVGQYEVFPNEAFPSAVSLYLNITPGHGASQGSGQVVLVIEP